MLYSVLIGLVCSAKRSSYITETLPQWECLFIIILSLITKHTHYEKHRAAFAVCLCLLHTTPIKLTLIEFDLFCVGLLLDWLVCYNLTWAHIRTILAFSLNIPMDMCATWVFVIVVWHRGECELHIHIYYDVMCLICNRNTNTRTWTRAEKLLARR